LKTIKTFAFTMVNDKKLKVAEMWRASPLFLILLRSLYDMWWENQEEQYVEKNRCLAVQTNSDSTHYATGLRCLRSTPLLTVSLRLVLPDPTLIFQRQEAAELIPKSNPFCAACCLHADLLPTIKWLLRPIEIFWVVSRRNFKGHYG